MMDYKRLSMFYTRIRHCLVDRKPCSYKCLWQMRSVSWFFVVMIYDLSISQYGCGTKAVLMFMYLYLLDTKTNSEFVEIIHNQPTSIKAMRYVSMSGYLQKSFCSKILFGIIGFILNTNSALFKLTTKHNKVIRLISM